MAASDLISWPQSWLAVATGKSKTGSLSTPPDAPRIPHLGSASNKSRARKKSHPYRQEYCKIAVGNAASMLRARPCPRLCMTRPMVDWKWRLHYCPRIRSTELIRVPDVTVSGYCLSYLDLRLNNLPIHFPRWGCVLYISFSHRSTNLETLEA